VGRQCRRICEVVPTPLANALAYDTAVLRTYTERPSMACCVT